MIFWCIQNGNHPKNNSPKFGYILDMKVEKETKSFSIFGYMLELITKIIWFGIFFFEILTNFNHLSMKNPLYRSKSYFLGCNLEKLLTKKTLVWNIQYKIWSPTNSKLIFKNIFYHFTRIEKDMIRCALQITKILLHC